MDFDQVPARVARRGHQADDPQPAAQSGLREIRSSYTDIAARPGDGRRVAGLPTSAVVVSARNRRGVPVRILVAAAQGRRRAWLVQVFTAAEGSTARLVEAQVALGSLVLEG